jgi:hypothetical protein
MEKTRRYRTGTGGRTPRLEATVGERGAPDVRHMVLVGLEDPGLVGGARTDPDTVSGLRGTRGSRAGRREGSQTRESGHGRRAARDEAGAREPDVGGGAPLPARVDRVPWHGPGHALTWQRAAVRRGGERDPSPSTAYQVSFRYRATSSGPAKSGPAFSTNSWKWELALWATIAAWSFQTSMNVNFAGSATSS